MRDRSEATAEFGPPVYLAEILYATLRQRWIIASVLLMSVAASLVYLHYADEKYTARTLLISVDQQDQSSLDGVLDSALPGLGGIFSSKTASKADVALELARTRDFLFKLLSDRPRLAATLLPACAGPNTGGLLKCAPVHRWAALGNWRNDVLRSGVDEDTGLYWLEVTLPDPELAAVTANDVVRRIDKQMREQKLEETRANIRYLSLQLSSTSQVDVRETITKLLQRQLEQQMLASNENVYLFRVLEAAAPPVAPSAPKTVLIIIAAGTLGLLLGLIIAFINASHQILSGKTVVAFPVSRPAS